MERPMRPARFLLWLAILLCPCLGGLAADTGEKSELFSTYHLSPLPPPEVPEPTPTTDPTARADGLRLLAAARDAARSATPGPHGNNGKNTTLSKIATVQARAGDFDGARETLHGTKDGDWNTDVTQARCRITVEQAKAGDIAGALTALAAVPADGSYQGDRVANAQADIAREQIKRGDLAGARNTAHSIKKTDTYDNGVPQRILLGDIAAAEAKAGDLVGAEAMIKMFKDPDDRASTWHDIVSGQYDADHFDAAISLSHHMPIRKEFWTQGDVLKDIAFDLATKGDLAGAKRFADAILDPDMKDIARGAVAALEAQQGDDAAADAVTRQMHHPLAIIAAWRRIGLARGRRGDMPGARQAFERGVQETRTARARKDLNVEYCVQEITEWQVNTGDLEGAQATARQVPVGKKDDHAAQSDAWLAVAKAQARSGDTAGARSTLGDIHDADEKAEAQAEIAHALVQAGDLDGARQAAHTAQKLLADDKEPGDGLVAKIAVVLAETDGVQEAMAYGLSKQPSSPIEPGIGGLRQFVLWLAETKGEAAAEAWAAALPEPLLRAYADLALALRRLNLPDEDHVPHPDDEKTC